MMEEIPLRTYLTARARVDFQAITAGTILENAFTAKEILSYDEDGEPHIRVDGILTPNGPDLIDTLMGSEGTSYKQIITSLYAASTELIDSGNSRGSIYLHVNSPGGTVNGAEAAAAVVANMARTHNVVAINEGVMASAALWLGSGATEITSRGRSTLTGSVGALATAVEYNNDSVKLYHFTNPESPNKVPDPSTEEGAQVFIDRVSGIYSIFRDDLIAGRNGRTTVEKVESLKGALVTAQQAMEVGLIDRIIDERVSSYTPAVAGQDGIAAGAAEDREENMNLSEFLKEHPEAQAELDAKISQARAEGEQAATDRHNAVVAKLKPIMDGGYPERVKTACADAISGTRSVDSVLDLVAIFDEIRAKDETNKSDDELEDMPDTPSSGPAIVTKADQAIKRDAAWNEAINGLLG